MRKPSILQTEKECYVTGQKSELELHHIYTGPNRKISDQEGFWVWLSADWHRHNKKSVHLDPHGGIDLLLKRNCQIAYEREHSREEFIKLIGKSYL